jgi:hypothetical protein
VRRSPCDESVHLGNARIDLSDQGHSKVFLGDIQVIGDHFDPDGGESYIIIPLRKGSSRNRAFP